MTTTDEHSTRKHRIQTTNGYKRVYDEALDYIRERYPNTGLSLGSFCSYRHYSVRHVQRALLWFGTTWRALLTEFRVKRAQILMRETDLTITSIATQVGFTHSSHLAKAHRRVHGMTPSEYRGRV